MKTEYRYMRMMNIGDTGKTSRWSVHNRRTNGCLGEIKWHGAWRSYAFFPFSDTVFDAGCMGDIIDFIGQLSVARTGGAPAEQTGIGTMDAVALAARFVANDPADFHRRGVMIDFVRWIGQTAPLAEPFCPIKTHA